MAGLGNPPDPLRSYAYKIYIPDFGDEALAHFTECSSLAVQVTAIKYTEGGNSPITYKLPGAVNYGDIILKYGLTTSTEMYSWFLAGVHGRIDYRHVSIAMLDTQGAVALGVDGSAAERGRADDRRRADKDRVLIYEASRSGDVRADRECCKRSVISSSRSSRRSSSLPLTRSGRPRAGRLRAWTYPIRKR